jgi:hypothetical protein
LYPDIAQPNHLANTNLARLAQLHRAIHGDRAAGDHGLAGAAAVAQAGKFQQLVELNVISGMGDRK